LYFEWDNKVAGPLYREVQAGRLIRSVKLTREGDAEADPVRLRAWVSVPDGAGHRQYEPTDDAMADPFKSRMVLRDMERRFLDLQRTFGHLAEYAALIQGEAGRLEAAAT